LGKLAISLYLGKSSMSSAYGAAGSLVILLVWVYYSAQILFFGAEFTQIYANRFGSKLVPEGGAVPEKEASAAPHGVVYPEHSPPGRSTPPVPEQQRGAAARQGRGQQGRQPLPATGRAVQEQHGIKMEPRQIHSVPRRPELLPQPEPNMLAVTAVLATLVGFVSGMVIQRVPKSKPEKPRRRFRFKR
jgi:hypothetical protein